MEHVEELTHRLAGRLVDALPADRVPSPTSPESGLVVIDVPDPAVTVERLAQSDVVVQIPVAPDALLVSVHAFNTEGEVDTVATALVGAW